MGIAHIHTTHFEFLILSSFFIGPFIITKSFSDTLYEITPIPPNPSNRIRTASIDKLRKIKGKVDLGDECVGFNVKTSKYINIDSDVQLKYLSDEVFNKHVKQYSNIISSNNTCTIFRATGIQRDRSNET